MDPFVKDIVGLLGEVGGPVVGVLLTFKMLLNGMRKDVTDTLVTVKSMDEKLDSHEVRIVRLETHREHEHGPLA